ncbi:hypothetical protein [Halomarina pelagica]|uniref:hypothetical protein n=1 Tax=Halomarina pelagica TaxID=2961599 RepID=UPI0020C511DE|nr:hypothetical protein [Halomarina sp. BND7]
MGQSSNSSDDGGGEAEYRQYPFGLSSYQLFFFVVLVGLITPGLVVYFLETSNLSGIADLVWIVGYGTTVFVVWFIWIRPLDLIGSSGHDTSLPDTDAEDASADEDEESIDEEASNSGSDAATDTKRPDATKERSTETDPTADAG